MNEHLLSARIKKGWSQEKAAEAANVSVRTYQRWENGESIPNFASRKLLREAFSSATDEELGFDLPLPQSRSIRGKKQRIVRLTCEDLAALFELLKLGEDLMDGAKRDTLGKLIKLMGAGVGVSLILADADPIDILPPKAVGNHLDLDVIGSYAKALQELLAKGEAHYVMRSAQDLYHKLVQEHLYSTDRRLAEVQLCLGMLVGAAQEYALPWYQRDQTVMRTYNHIENNILCKLDVNDTLQLEYARLLAKRGRQHRVLWQFEECVKECEDGLASLREREDFSLRTHFLCERAHIEATRGNELLWMHKLEEARRGALDMKLADRERALNQVDYMQGEGYKRFAFHIREDLSLPVRERYAKLALHQFTQWQGATIELPGFEALVAQVSRAQCLILIDPDEAINIAGQVEKQAEQRYPALLDKIHRVVFLAQQRLQMRSSEFLQIFQEGSAYHAGRNVL